MSLTEVYKQLRYATYDYLWLKFEWFEDWMKQKTLFKVCHKGNLFKLGRIIHEVHNLIPIHFLKSPFHIIFNLL